MHLSKAPPLSGLAQVPEDDAHHHQHRDLRSDLRAAQRNPARRGSHPDPSVPGSGADEEDHVEASQTQLNEEHADKVSALSHTSARLEGDRAVWCRECR